MTASTQFLTQPGWISHVFNGLTYSYISFKPTKPDRPTILFLHGTPTGPLTFRSLIPLVLEAGYGVICPELLGYGRTDKPLKMALYAHKKMSKDITLILDEEGINKVVVFAHDHGALLAPRFVQHHPERVIALILVSIPYFPPADLDYKAVSAQMKQILGYENFGYWDFFVEDPDAAKLIVEHAETFLTIGFCAYSEELMKTRFCPPGALKASLQEGFVTQNVLPWFPAEKETYIKYIVDSGMEAPLMWYRAMAGGANTEDNKKLSQRLSTPFLFLLTKLDEAVPPPFAAAQVSLCDDLTVKEFDKAGHWVCEDDPKGVFTALNEWLVNRGFAS